MPSCWIVFPLFLVASNLKLCLAQTPSDPVNGTTLFFPPSQKFYSSEFVSPSPPNIQPEFRANYMQHKFDTNINNHIVSGFIYVSPSQQKVRADAAGDGFLEASFFDFQNTTSNGSLVANAIVSFDGGVSEATCSSFFVPPFMQLFPADFLAQSNAVFSGIQIDELYGPVDTWTFSKGDNLLYHFDRLFKSRITGGCELNQYVIRHASWGGVNNTINKV